ncbi:uncharacterized protein LOC129237065 [Anastrepha obliqua]|uniref:uncharacterized protein LOC129237065 n=1 Tax=Anastrepha obliqua TaxID=95512 RepID=UPI0024099FF5|nr:uncharacterized protein LOC129237065 [Anastrepha obliqua]
MSPIQHLHDEANMLPVKEHNKMLGKQFLLGCQRRPHPCRHLLEPEPPPRHIRRHFLNYVDEILDKTDRPLQDETVYRQTINDIHQETLTIFLSSRPPNAVIGVQPPPIADEELQLPRESRVILAQLRSGYCSRLNSYLSRIDPDILNICPACEGTPHDTNHLFTCPNKPTHLTPLSLWTQPVETASFLGLPLDELDEDDR